MKIRTRCCISVHTIRNIHSFPNQFLLSREFWETMVCLWQTTYDKRPMAVLGAINSFREFQTWRSRLKSLQCQWERSFHAHLTVTIDTTAPWQRPDVLKVSSGPCSTRNSTSPEDRYIKFLSIVQRLQVIILCLQELRTKHYCIRRTFQDACT